MDRELEDVVVTALKKGMNQQLLHYLDSCTRCSICKDACHQYAMTQDLVYLPAYRAEVVRQLYRRYLTPKGRVLATVRRTSGVDESWLNELYRVSYSCTGCRRCMYYCPFSIDTSWVLAMAKAILVAARRSPLIMNEICRASIFKGQHIDSLMGDIVEALGNTERDLQEKIGDSGAKIPVGVKGADILFVSLPGAYSILPAAIIFHRARANWSLSVYEPANFGYFLGDTNMAVACAKRIVDEARRLQVKEVVISECGHGYRVMKWLCEAWSKERNPFKVACILEVIARYVKEGRIHLRQGAVRDSLTYHDPCQLARNGGIYEEPRYILRQIAADFRELTPNRERNWCCGGGGGLQAEPELEEFRLKTGEKKVKQIRESGARIVVAPCDNCRLQLEDLNSKHNLNVKVCSVTELVAEAVVVAEPVCGTSQTV